MRGSIVSCLAVAATLIVAAGAGASRDEAMIACVEGGGIYYDDGHCEGGKNGDPAPEAAPADQDGEQASDGSDEDREAAAKKECRRQGGRYRKDGSCDIRRDPIKDCKGAGGIFMVDGKCYKPAY